MANEKETGYLRATPAGTGVAGASVTAKLHSDNSAITGGTDTTDANGRYDILSNKYPGEHYVEIVSGSVTKVVSTIPVGWLGTFSAADLPVLMRALRSGVIDGEGNELAVTHSADLTVQVDTGGGLGFGHPFYFGTTQNVTVNAADGSNPRIDLIVMRVTKPGATDAGKIVPTFVTGTPAASPVAPSPVNDATSYDIPLAEVTVPTGSGTITTVTDRREFVGPTNIDLTDATVVGTLPLNRGGTGATTAAGARTNLELAAGLAGDIWVEKAGDTMTGNLVISGANLSAVGGTFSGALSVGGATTLTGDVTMSGGSGALTVSGTTLIDSDSALAFRVRDAAGTTTQFNVNGSTGGATVAGALDVGGNADIAGTLDVAGASDLLGRVLVKGDNSSQFIVQKADGSHVMEARLDAANRRVQFDNGAILAGYSDDSTTNTWELNSATGGIVVGGALDHNGSTVGFYGATPVVKQTVSGSRGGNAALADLLTELAELGLITDSTTA